MRTIEFRGKNINGAWVFGAYEKPMKYGCHKIISHNHDGTYSYAYDVKPETVGQNTGLYDVNGDSIFEGDILEEVETGKRVAVVYNAPQFCFRDNEFGYKFLNHTENFFIAGTIYDSPELLEKGGNQ